MDYKKIIRTIPDFPKQGILFYDISSLLMHSEGFHCVIDDMAEIISPLKPDLLLAIEARGFLLAAPLAYKLNLGFAMIRKQGKLPGSVISHQYDLEYGQDMIQIQADAIKKGQNIVILDDLLATGGTLSAAVDLTQKLGGNISMALTIIELIGLNGRDKIHCPFHSLVQCTI